MSESEVSSVSPALFTIWGSTSGVEATNIDFDTAADALEPSRVDTDAIILKSSWSDSVRISISPSLVQILSCCEFHSEALIIIEKLETQMTLCHKIRTADPSDAANSKKAQINDDIFVKSLICRLTS